MDHGQHHDHMVDVETGKVIEFPSPEIEVLQKQIADKHGYVIEEHAWCCTCARSADSASWIRPTQRVGRRASVDLPITATRRRAAFRRCSRFLADLDAAEHPREFLLALPSRPARCTALCGHAVAGRLADLVVARGPAPRPAAGGSRTAPGALRPSARSFCPTTSATAPPMPVSTSSKTIVGTASMPSAATSIAREMRASSPPEATLRSARGGCPGLAETRNSQRSAPSGSGRSPSMRLQLDLRNDRRPCPARRSARWRRPPANCSLAPRLAPGHRRRLRQRGCGAGDLDVQRLARARRRRARPRARPPAHRVARSSCSGVTRCLRARSCRRSSARSSCSKAAGSRSRSSRRRSSRVTASSSWMRARFEHARSTSARRGSCRHGGPVRCAPAAAARAATGRRRRQARKRAVVGSDQPGGMGLAAMAGDADRRWIRDRASRAAVPRTGVRARRCVRRRRRCATASSRSRSRVLQRQRRRAHCGQCGAVRPKASSRSSWLAVEQRLVLVLAVDLDQRAGEFAQLASVAGRPLIQAREPPSARMMRRSWQRRLPASRRVRCRAARRGIGRVGQVEFGRQLGAFGAMAHHAGVGAGAGQEEQGVDQQRLAGAGFAGNHGQARVESQFGGADDGEILDGQVGEHGAAIVPCRDANRPSACAALRPALIQEA